MLKGIVIVAVGHAQYGRMAYNLALSIKAVEDISICVVKSDFSLAHLSIKQLEIFDHVVDLPGDAPIGCGAKLWANLVTPYDCTLVLDADMLWLPERPPSELFDELKDAPFTAITEGYHPDNLHEKYFLWADPDEIKSKYDIKSEKLYQWRSEVMYFKKGMDSFFELTRQIYIAPGLSTEKLYGNTTADELALVIACGMLDIHPHEYKWIPAYWYLMNGGRIPEITEIYGRFYLASFGANQASGDAIKLYDKIMKIACYKKGLPHVFPLISKKSYLPERAKM
ncbi:MAG: hypothetical protein H0X33_14155 [Taibaiella sp.]|nr:hypothetical protein [Taibaiella sp.]